MAKPKLYRKSRVNKKRTFKRSFPSICDKNMSFQECELAILRQAVDENEKESKNKIANSDEVQKMVSIVEDFLRSTKCICYGGTAINNILPEESQFYDKSIEIPDYDFFSKTPVKHAKQLATIFHEQGYTEVEAKAGVHYGTYKVFVNFIPMADITMLHPKLYGNLQNEAIVINSIHYTPPNFLRMSMFLELSRPQGDVSRWEKVLKRLTLLNQHYPLKADKCHEIDFQRSLDHSPNDSSRLYSLVKDSFIDQRVVFFGGYATSLYSRYMSSDQRRIVQSIPDFDVLSTDPDQCAQNVSAILKQEGFSNVKIVKYKSVDEVIPEHYELLVGKDTLAFIYKPIACHNYNEIRLNKRQTVRVATIDTILSFYLAFLYADMNYFGLYKDRLLCMSQFLFKVEQKNRLEQKGLLKRFTMTCYGTQSTLETIRAQKTEMFQALRNTKSDDPVKEAWFLKFNPATDFSKKPKQSRGSNRKNKKTTSTQSQRKTRKNSKQKESEFFM